MIRPASEADVPALVSMVISAWGTGDYGEASMELYRSYVEGISAASSFSFVWSDGGQVLGAVYCRMEEDCAYRMPSPGISAAMLRLMMTGGVEEVRSDLRRMIDLTDELLEETGRQFDGELMLILVSPHVRGRGIGTSLFSRAVGEFSRRGAGDVYIVADDQCDRGFLASRGAEQLSMVSADLRRGFVRSMVYGYRIRRGDDASSEAPEDSTRS